MTSGLAVMTVTLVKPAFQTAVLLRYIKKASPSFINSRKRQTNHSAPTFKMCGRFCDLLIFGSIVFILLAFTAGSVFDQFFFEQVDCQITDVKIQKKNFDDFDVDVKILYLETDVKVEYHVHCSCTEYVCQKDCFREQLDEKKEQVGETMLCNQHHEIASVIYMHQFWFLSDNPRTPSKLELTLYVFTGLFSVVWCVLFYNRFLAGCRCYSVGKTDKSSNV